MSEYVIYIKTRCNTLRGPDILNYRNVEDLHLLIEKLIKDTYACGYRKIVSDTKVSFHNERHGYLIAVVTSNTAQAMSNLLDMSNEEFDTDMEKVYWYERRDPHEELLTKIRQIVREELRQVLS